MKPILLSIALLVPAMPAFADVIPISELQRGQPATVAGVVERFHDEDEIRLRDETGTVRVYLGPQPVALDLGQRIEVSGFMDNDLIRNELYAREIVAENGETITVERRYE
ncbi:hypothetical protein [Litoreibacter roseus]|uniref:NirD/YgiW/YdeI family stress tolerance protein n=1 Tax=Litoreibacter roseus TaxID=2601869 RepID=A0A6N6JCU2_9RHOB|nr:hypothetical protein [Litoreibacter roseus]GFE63986.1 hypothetical protein KIN_10600 [Litoreibacter roseus]